MWKSRLKLETRRPSRLLLLLLLLLLLRHQRSLFSSSFALFCPAPAERLVSPVLYSW